jgi:outer membrane protein TolC
MAESDGKVTSNLIALYKALGGGWPSLTADDKT